MEFWNDKMANTDNAILDKLVASVKEKSGVDMKIVPYPDVAAYQTALQQSIKESSAPGMFTWWNGFQLETLAQNGLLEDLTEEWENYYIPAGVSRDVADSLTVDGKIVAAPYGVFNNTVIYNKKVFEAAGAEIPTTFAEFETALEKIKASGVTPIALKNDSWASFIWFQQFIAAQDPQIYLDICDGTKPYTDESVVAVMEVWKGLIDKGYFHEPVKGEDMLKAFARGESAMMLEPVLTIPNLVNQYGMTSGEDFDAFVVPSATGGKAVVFFEVSPICIPSASASKETAKEVLRSYYNPDTQKILVDELGMPSTSTVQIDDPTMARMVGFSGESDKYQLILRYYESTPAEIRDVALDELSRFMYSGAPIEDVLATIQKKADEVFGS